MAKKRFLEELIANLNQGELKTFSLYTKTYGAKKNYLEIFNDIKKSKTSKPKKYDNKYAQQRRYLYRVILESLVQKSYDNSIQGEVFFLINSANYLLKKQLPDQAYAIINKALDLVRKHEMFGYHLEILELEKQVRLFTNPSEYRSDKEIIEEEKNLIIYQKELQTLKLIYNHLQNYKKKFGFVDLQSWLKLKDEITEMGLYPDELYYKTNKTRFYYNLCQASLFIIGRRYIKAYNSAKRFINLPQTSLSQQEILNGLLQYTTSALLFGNTTEVLERLHDIKKAYEQGRFGFYDRTTLQIFYYRSNYELSSYIFEGQKENVYKKITEIEEELSYWNEKIPLEIKMVLASVLKLGYYAIGNIKKANQYVQFLIQNYNSGLRLDAYEDGLIYNLMFIFEKNDMDYLESEARKTYNYFGKKFEKIENQDILTKKNIAKIFLDYALYKIDEKKLLLSFKKQILNKFNLSDNGFLEIEYSYLIWVNSKLQQQDFLETAVSMTKQYLNKSH